MKMGSTLRVIRKCKMKSQSNTTTHPPKNVQSLKNDPSIGEVVKQLGP